MTAMTQPAAGGTQTRRARTCPRPEYPFTGPRAERKKRAREVRLQPTFDPAEEPAPPPVDRAALLGIARAHGVRLPDDLAILCLKVEGLDTRQIAARLGVGWGRVRNKWRKIRLRLAARMSADAQVASPVQEAFADQQRIQRYQAPRHCPPGQEQCRNTGVCPFAVLHF